jgi:HemY protein
MRLLLWLVALMAAAIGIAVTARFNPGNVVFFYPPHRIDMSLNLFVVLAALLFLLLYGLARAVRATLRMPERVAAYRQRKREREGNKGLRDALKALFEGRFGHAEKAAMRAAELPENAGLAALIGARAAHRMREPARRDAWLAGIAHDNALKTARLMTVTELLVDDHQPEAALEAVAELNASGQRHIHALQWSMKANQQARNWPEVLRLVRIAGQAQGAASGAVGAPARTGLRSAAGRRPRCRIDPRVWAACRRRPHQALHRGARRQPPSMRAACTTKPA